MNYPQPPQPQRSNGGQSFAAGGPVGAIDEATGDAGGAISLVGNLQSALAVVQEALAYGRQLHGLGGGQQEAAARMPMAPGTQSESGRRELPAPGPLPPTQNPFGKRTAAIDTGDEPEPAQEQVAEAATPTGEEDEEMA